MEGVLKILAVGGVLWVLIQSLIPIIHLVFRLKTNKEKEHIQLLSDRCEKHIIDTMKDFRETTSEGMKHFVEDATDLLQKLKSETKRTASKSKKK